MHTLIKILGKRAGVATQQLTCLSIAASIMMAATRWHYSSMDLAKGYRLGGYTIGAFHILLKGVHSFPALFLRSSPMVHPPTGRRM